MSYAEHTLSFDCEGERLQGIVSTPAAGRPVSSTGVVIVVGGPQYRAGSHRQFVLLARSLAADGFAVLRFDYRGMGDSGGAQRDFQAVDADIAAGIAALQTHLTAVKSIVLWGLCDGASAALLYRDQHHDPRISGLCLLNPWVRSEASLARAQVKHYYRQRLLEKAFWLKLLSGRVGRDALGGLWANIGKALNSSKTAASTVRTPYQDRMAKAWHEFEGSILLILSENDLTAKEFVDFTTSSSAWAGALSRKNVIRQLLPGADHTLSDSTSLTASNNLVREYLSRHALKDKP